MFTLRIASGGRTSDCVSRALIITNRALAIIIGGEGGHLMVQVRDLANEFCTCKLPKDLIGRGAAALSEIEHYNDQNQIFLQIWM
ncbi:MAG: hypothetical protein EZS28_042990, partial [Streblomastix strix]